MNRRRFIVAAAASMSSACLLPNYSVAQNQSGWKIGIYTRPWDKHDYRTALDAMADIGYKYAGIMTDKKGLVVGLKTSERAAIKVGKEAKQRGLQIISVYGGPFNADKSLKAGIKGLKKLINNVAACDGKNLLLGGTGNRRVYDDYYQAVRESCDYAADLGVILTIKPHGGLNATGPQCRKIIELVNHPNFQLWYDPGNIYYYSDGQLDPLDDVKSVQDKVSGMCVKDYLHPKEVLVTPGKGMVKFPALFARLLKAGFRSAPLVIECLSKGDLRQTKQQALKAKLYLEQIVGSPG